MKFRLKETPFLILLLVVSCVKLNPEEVNNSTTINSDGLVLIGNEGNFQYGNASLSSFNKTTGETNYNIYQELNDSQLGDVLHSISHIDHDFYLVINNSGKIIIVDDQSLLYKNEINQLNSPRKIIKVSNGKFYITDLYGSKLYVYNSYDESLSEIKVTGWCEDLLKHNGEAFVCNVENNQIYVIDINSNSLVDSIPVVDNPICIKEDNLQRLWVLSRGSSQNNISSSISIINPQTREIINTFSLENNESSASKLRINNSTNEVYFLNKHVYKINSINETNPELIWINTGENFYNLEIDPYNNDIYLTNARDYVQNGALIVLDNQGNFKGEYDTQIIPKSIVF
jgi:YVTN family beta-propeller protein